MWTFRDLNRLYNKVGSKFNVYFESRQSSFKVAKVRLRNRRATALLKKSWKLLRILFETYEDLEYFTSTGEELSEHPNDLLFLLYLMCRVECGWRLIILRAFRVVQRRSVMPEF